MRQTSLVSAWSMHSSMHIWHIAMQASSIAIMTAGVIPSMRSMLRIMVLHMSAQFMQAEAQSIPCVAQITHACSHAEQASMHACMAVMSIASMPGIDEVDIAPIIIASITHTLPSEFRGPAARLIGTLLLASRPVTGSSVPGCGTSSQTPAIA